MADLGKVDVFFAVKDVGPLEMLGPIAVKCAEANLDVAMLAEKPALDAVLPRYGIIPDEYDEGLGTLSDQLRQECPKVIVVGCSSPMNIERKVAAAAQDLKIPVVVVADIRGAWKRMPNLTGALVLVADEADAAAVRHRGFGAAVVGYRQAVLPAPSPTIEKRVKELRSNGKRVVLFASSGQPKRFAMEMHCVLACSRLTPDKHVLIHQPNKKILGQAHPEGGTWAEWMKCRLPESVVEMEGPVVRYADMTISPSSQCMTALAAGKIGVGLRVADAEDILASEPGVVEQLELYENLRMPIIRHPQSFSSLFRAGPPMASLRPFNAAIAVEAIKKFASL